KVQMRAANGIRLVSSEWRKPHSREMGGCPEGSDMPHRVLRNPLRTKILKTAAWAIVFALALAPSSVAQRPAHPASGGRAPAPRAVPPAPIAAPQTQAPAPRMHSGVAHAHGAVGPGVQVPGVSTVRVALRPTGGFRQPFIRGSFPRTRLAFGFN